MDLVLWLLIFAIAYFVLMFTLTAASKRHLFLHTDAPPELALATCGSKLTRFFWKRVDGPGDLNCRYRFNIPVRGSRAPVLSISADVSDHGPGTDIEVWMSDATTLYGIINMAERIVFAKWSIGRAVRSMTPVPTQS
ncbi:hypothetical protein [Gordonia alkanivorans]|uniref:hypothetical protein n=1 Tax=Gordonia alkanivorans TaxID=84096 RepID=UPI001F4D57CD|nr:hypothetical protein [Gordonia alkanivorans]